MCVVHSEVEEARKKGMGPVEKVALAENLEWGPSWVLAGSLSAA